jgi:hypothetical protein
MFRTVSIRRFAACLLLAACVSCVGCRSSSWFSWGGATAHSTAETGAYPSSSFHQSHYGGTDNPGEPMLRPGDDVSWTIESVQSQRFIALAGESVVSSDGTLELGRYGRFKVTGIPVVQASLVMEEHVKGYIANPRVNLTRKGLPQSQVSETGSNASNWTSHKTGYSNWESAPREKQSSGWNVNKSSSESLPCGGWKCFEDPARSVSQSGNQSVSGTAAQSNPPARKYGPIMGFFMGKG